MKIAVVKETAAGEKRVAISPEAVKKYVGLGAEVMIEAGAGAGANWPDTVFSDQGASIEADAGKVLDGADVILSVRGVDEDRLSGVKSGALLVALVDPYNKRDRLDAYAKAGLTVLSMEFIPRITRAQAMDSLSSQSNLAGYKAVLDATEVMTRAFPMMMTAAGTIAPARVFVMGAGVAGLQAIATAKRLGAIVSATDVRLAAKEQVESLGGKFVFVDDEEAREAETAGGYAKEMSDAYKAKQAELVATTIAKQDVVITTALIPGKKAPTLVTDAMVESMKPGSVIVDLAVEQGGNCTLSRPGEIVDHNGVKIIGHTNMPSRLSTDASSLYAKNLFNLVDLMIDKESKALSINWDDEIIKGTCVVRDGAVGNPRLDGQAA